jgi:mycothiol synthase
MAGSQSKQPETEHYASKSDADLSADVDQPVGFVNVLGTWVDQVGVVPPYRGRLLGAHLVAHVLGALAAEGADGCWLTVNVDNPADQLYRSLGFRVVGRRARYAAAG